MPLVRAVLLVSFAVAVAAILAPPAAAQRGDRAGEAQPLLPASVVVPPATPRSPADELATFAVPRGIDVALFASEPLVGDPVAVAFDAAGRLWVVEMRGYMNDLDATDERAPNGRIVVLHDDDGDGRADRSTVFADGLVLPRAVLPLVGGALVLSPPHLYWCADADGDLVADDRTVVLDGFEAGLENPEHSGNGLLWGLDHRIHLANDRRMLCWRGLGRFDVEEGAGGGQWGITQDDRGRLYFNYNEDWLRCDLVPGHHGPAAARVGGLPQLNHRVVATRSVWPSRITPGVNRGYQPGRLVDHVLAIHTAVCAPHVYRGGLLPFDGDVFVCEPAGNCVRRIVLAGHDGWLQGENPYEADRKEFLTSTDERFRPVHLATGPDGALYVVDMYRGVIQHKNFVTTFLRDQIERRSLERPIGLGRIWRLAPSGHAARAPAAPPTLTENNGVRRDLALAELVQRSGGDRARLAAEVRQALQEPVSPAVRITLYAALDGLGALTATELRRAVRDDDVGVVGFAFERLGPFLRQNDGHLWAACERQLVEGPPALRWRALLALGDVLAAPVRQELVERAVGLLAEAAAGAGADRGTDADGLLAVVATAAGASLGDVLVRVAQHAAGEAAAVPVAALAERLVRRRDAALQEDLFVRARLLPEVWQRRAVLVGAVRALPKGAVRLGWLRFEATPDPLVQLAADADDETRAAAHELLGAVQLTGAARSRTTPLSGEQQALVRRGEQVFRRTCAACHQLDGKGMPGLAPPLCDSDWALGEPRTLVRIVLHGIEGPIDVGGQAWSLSMPGQSVLTDDDIAAVTTYVRRAFGHAASPIEAPFVQGVRQADAARTQPWTAVELLGGR
jgi:mono/diheme cytochrome c family protein/glucose/arabinose dehydrogenase